MEYLYWEKKMGIPKDMRMMFQSLFWWNTSIEPACGDAYRPGFLFQSLFWWNTSIERRKGRLERCAVQCVSILVLMEYLYWAGAWRHNLHGLPVSILVLMEYLYWGLKPGTPWPNEISFNPCSDGIPLLRLARRPIFTRILSFNPCSDGIPLLSENAIAYIFANTSVSILVLMEYLYWDQTFQGLPRQLCSFNPCSDGIPLLSHR